MKHFIKKEKGGHRQAFDVRERQLPIAKPTRKITIKKAEKGDDDEASGEMKLNKFVAHCGIAARRKAAELVKMGKVQVNGKEELNPAYVVKSTDKVQFEGKPIRPEGQRVYLLMNKPKDAITTLDDERGRKTVMDLIGNAVRERIFPVGRLDRDTTGLLLLTNDGELAQRMAHPSHKVQKIYHAQLNKIMPEVDIEQIRKGVELEDGRASVNWIRYVEGTSKTEVELEIVIGKNRVVRRIFEHLGYEVLRLDRTWYAGLTKKDLPRGRFRHLTQREVIMLKHFTGK